MIAHPAGPRHAEEIHHGGAPPRPQSPAEVLMLAPNVWPRSTVRGDDGGMSDNIRTSLYGAEYDVRLVSRISEMPAMLSRVVGKHCESGDIVVKDAWLSDDVAPGDLLGVAATGAYCYSMSSRYNLIGRPAVVAVRNGHARLILRRETVDDLLSLEVTK